MKANEAPEKIILSADRDTQIINDYWVVNDYTDNIKIEYTRTDAFIEKVCDFLKSYRQDTFDGTGYIAGIINDKNYWRLHKLYERRVNYGFRLCLL